MKRSIGVDLHKSAFTVCYYESGEKVEFKTYQVNMKSLEYFKKTLKKTDELAVESTGNTAFFVREIQSKVKRVRVVNPFQFKVISNSVKKEHPRLGKKRNR